MLRIDEVVPDDPLAAEVVLHLRRLLRTRIRREAPDAGAALALLFGFPIDGDRSSAWSAAAREPQPFQAGAALALELGGSRDGVVPLGHKPDHVARCLGELRKRMEQDRAFEAMAATDIATLLEFSKARELAAATTPDGDGNRRPLAILIRGETGTGKELLAHAIHRLAVLVAGRADAPFEVLHVAGMSPDMLNDELFGHEKGAFTDARTE